MADPRPELPADQLAEANALAGQLLAAVGAVSAGFYPAGDAEIGKLSSSLQAVVITASRAGMADIDVLVAIGHCIGCTVIQTGDPRSAVAEILDTALTVATAMTPPLSPHAPGNA